MPSLGLAPMNTIFPRLNSLYNSHFRASQSSTVGASQGDASTMANDEDEQYQVESADNSELDAEGSDVDAEGEVDEDYELGLAYMGESALQDATATATATADVVADEDYNEGRTQDPEFEVEEVSQDESSSSSDTEENDWQGGSDAEEGDTKTVDSNRCM